MRRRVLLWLLCLCLLAGCGGGAPEDAAEPETGETPEETALPPVYTDWSHLTPYVPVEPVYTRFTPYSGSDTVRARSDYGPLLPYVGVYAQTGSYMGPLPLLGLVTAQGRLVTAPVYADVHMVTDGGRGLFLILSRGNCLGVEEYEWGSSPYGDFTYTVLAPDGRWVREFSGGDSYFLLSPTELALSCSDGSVTVLDTDGRTAACFPREALEPYLGEGFQWSWEGGPAMDARDGFLCVWRYDENDPEGDGIACYLDPDSGAVTGEPAAAPRPVPELPEAPEAEVPAGYDRAETITDPITGRTYRCAAQYGEETCDLLDEDGRLLRADLQMPYLVLGMGDGMFRPWVWGDRICCGEDGFFCYYDLRGELVFRYAVETNSD